MHYYSFNIADYRKDTVYLTLLEHGIYRTLLDTYYLNENPLSLNLADLMRSHGIRNADEIQACKNILKDFFIKTKAGYEHKNVEKNLSDYKAKSKKASESAKVRWSKVSGDANALNSHKESNADELLTKNHKPLTNNQEPIKSMAISPIEQAQESPPKTKRFVKPTIEELIEVFIEKGSTKNEANKFFNFYESNGWMVGKNKMKNWKSSVVGWISRQPNFAAPKTKEDQKEKWNFDDILPPQNVMRTIQSDEHLFQGVTYDQ